MIKTALNYDQIVAVAIEEAIEFGDLSSDVEHYLRKETSDPSKEARGRVLGIIHTYGWSLRELGARFEELETDLKTALHA